MNIYKPIGKQYQTYIYLYFHLIVYVEHTPLRYSALEEYISLGHEEAGVQMNR